MLQIIAENLPTIQNNINSSVHGHPCRRLVSETPTSGASPVESSAWPQASNIGNKTTRKELSPMAVLSGRSVSVSAQHTYRKREPWYSVAAAFGTPQ